MSNLAPPPIATIPQACRAQRTLSNVKTHKSPHLPRGSVVQFLPNRRRVPGAPCLPRKVRAHHPLDTHNLHNSPRVPRETATYHQAPRARSPTPSTRNHHAARTRRRAEFHPPNTNATSAHTRKKTSQTRPRPPDPHLYIYNRAG